MKVTDFFVDTTASVIEAMRSLGEAGRRILFVVKDGLLLAVLTDGDVRRYILGGGDLNASVMMAANQRPLALPISEKQHAKSFLKENAIDAVPLIDAQNKVVDIVFSDIFGAKSYEQIGLPVVMMAGGLGTRLYPYTKILPKPLIPIGEQPIAEHIIDCFCKFGCMDYYMVVNYRKNMIKSYFSESQHDYRLHYADEDIPLGTGGGLALLQGQLDHTFVLTNCDVLVDADFSDIYHFHKKNKNIITMICAFQHITIPYGVVELGKDGKIATMTEKPQMNYLTNTGVYLVEPVVIESMKRGQNIGFPEIVESWRQKDNNCVGVYPVSEECWMDMGQIETMEDMRRRLEATK